MGRKTVACSCLAYDGYNVERRIIHHDPAPSSCRSLVHHTLPSLSLTQLHVNIIIYKAAPSFPSSLCTCLLTCQVYIFPPASLPLFPSYHTAFCYISEQLAIHVLLFRSLTGCKYVGEITCIRAQHAISPRHHYFPFFVFQ